jgi:arabinogalactan oligomer/maltooligosaccharide transport system permease protein
MEESAVKSLGVRNTWLMVKILLLGIFSSVLGFMAFMALLGGEWLITTVLVVVIILGNYIYLSKKPVAAKFFYPGAIFLIIFLVVPIGYTGFMSTQLFKTGNLISREEAITQLNAVGLTPAESGVTYDMVVGRYEGNLAVLLTNQLDGTVSLGYRSELRSLTEGEYQIGDLGYAQEADGFLPIDLENDPNAEQILSDIKIPLENGVFIAAQGFDFAADMIETYRFDPATNTLVDISTGFILVDNGAGNFVNPDNPEEKLFPGWRAQNSGQNYLALFLDPRLNGPFVSVFIWTITFSILTMITMFGLGFLVAVVLDKKIRGRNLYRAIMILPYAIPSFMSTLVWAGMFNREIGVFNALLGAEIDWLNDPWLARGALLLVNLWLGFPYFYLVTTGALQALPGELEEAAVIDGATSTQIFWRIKLPLVLEILAPLLIASLAFNFNNFNLVFLLTRGGPTNSVDGELAGATDILITYAYKTAFSGAEQDLGLASAISVIIFVIIGALSLWSLRQSRTLEEQR